MKKLLLAATFSLIAVYTQAQICTGCTQTLSTTSSTPIIIGPGQKYCITSSGVLNASVTMSGGELCNEGTINGAFNATNGIINNYGICNGASLSINGSQVFNNYNIVTLSGAYSSSNSSEFYNHGGMSIMGSVNNNAFFYTSCMIKVNGSFSNNGTVTGPMSGCGGFTVLGGGNNNASFGVDNSNLDMCDSMNVGGWNTQNGTLGSNVTNCSCTDFCSTSIGTEEFSSVTTFRTFPNPGDEFTILNIDKLDNGPYTVQLVDIHGQVIRAITAPNLNQFVIERQGLASGMYLFRVVSENQILGKGKLLFK